MGFVHRSRERKPEPGVSLHLESGIAVLAIQGRLTRDSVLPKELHHEILLQLEQGLRRFVVDLEGVEDYDAAALGTLVEIQSCVDGCGGELQIAGHRDLATSYHHILEASALSGERHQLPRQSPPGSIRP